MFKLKHLIIISLALCLLMLAPKPAEAFDFFRTGPAPVCNSTTTKDSPVCQKPDNPNKNPVVDIIQVATSIIALLAGVLSVIMIIVSGLTLITSGGNQDAVTNSRKRITSAIIGLIIVALAWAIIRFITDKVIK